jgi:hypothetical protein
MKIKLLSLFLGMVSLLTPLVASEIGTITLYSFYNDTPLVGNEIRIDDKDVYKTDNDGSVVIFAEVGVHQIEIVGKDKKGKYLGYFKKPIIVKEDQDTQLIATFNDEEIPDVEIDTPLESTNTRVDLETAIKGRLNGVIVSSDSNKSISNARIFVKGTSIDARSDKDGKFSILIPADTNVSISVVHSEYSAQTINNIQVKESQIISLRVELTPASMELEEFVVLAPKVEGSLATIAAEEKQMNAIANILGSEEMSKKGDSSAASALRRVTGVTLIGGKSIYVRGLGDRYSNIEMNSLPIPSPNPLKRVIPLDIFPSGVIGSMKVQKSATADIPSSFGGGYVDIRTKDNSKDDYFKISMEVKGNSNTGKDVDTYQGSDTDFLGFDDGYRSINGSILANSKVVVGEQMQAFTTRYFTQEELEKFTQKYLNRNYNITNEKLPLGFKGAIEASQNFEIADNHKISLFGNYEYSQDNKFREEEYNKYSFNKETNELYKTPTQSGSVRKTTSEYSHTAIFNLGYNFMDVLKIKYTKLYTLNAEKNTRLISGIMGSNDEDMTKSYLDWEERTLNTDQLSGEFDYELFNHESNFRFGLEHANANLNQPNNYSYTYRNEGEVFLDNKVSNNISNELKSDDTLDAIYLSNKFHFDLLSEDDYLDAGFAMSSKTRQSRQNKYFLQKIGGSSKVDDLALTGDIEGIYDLYVRPDIDYADRAFLVSQLFKPADWYDAEVDEMSFYLNSFIKPTKSIEFLVGARAVDFSQVVYQYKEDRENPDMAKRRLIQRIPEELTLSSVYPSASLKYKHDKDNHIDLAYSQTYIVPDLREFTNGEYFHPYDVATIIGNPDLSSTEITNIDLKFSHYFSDTENIKLGLFYKYLDKPIEDVMLPSSSLPIYSFDNADFATLYGIEIDGRKNLDFIYAALKNYYISGNFSYTESEVTLKKEQEAIYSTNNRQLQGLSPTVVNLSLGYERRDRSATLSYNKMGKRIRKVGMIDDGDAFPDYYEVPPAILDFVWIEKFNNSISLRAKLGNLLDEETVWKQGNRVTNSFKKGRTFSLKASYRY